MENANRYGTFAAMAGLALLVCFLGWSQEQTSNRLDAEVQQTQATADFAAQAATGPQVVELPEDGGTYHTVLCLHDQWRAIPKERELVAWFQTEPALVSLAAQTHYTQLVESDRVYAEKFAQSVPTLPAVLVMTNEGRVIYKASGPDTPGGQQMAAELVGLFDKRPWLRILPWRRPRTAPEPEPSPCPDGQCPDQQKPQPPAADVAVDVPDLRPPEQPADSGVWIFAAVAVVVAAFAAVAIEWHKRTTT